MQLVKINNNTNKKLHKILIKDSQTKFSKINKINNRTKDSKSHNNRIKINLDNKKKNPGSKYTREDLNQFNNSNKISKPSNRRLKNNNSNSSSRNKVNSTLISKLLKKMSLRKMNMPPKIVVVSSSKPR
jgi:hypothetical protein